MRNLAPNKILNAVLIPIFLLAIYFLFTFDPIRIGLSLSDLIWVLAGYLALIAWIVLACLLPQNIYYDNENLYFKGLKRSKTIPLMNIFRLQQSFKKEIRIMGIRENYFTYTISYYDETSDLKQFSFSSTPTSSMFKAFIKHLIDVNQKVKIEEEKSFWGL